ncbi:ATP-binding protein [Zooshikella harenae]|uniref:histidine kinase n=1 Tax=Zooshikella harenae TaxID=2827238 RepID=A0ABS5ZIS0_9GAMM|nr:ATP-binding protein [Zooshikella harenae]MBU2713860.1 HAMP domain-containing histidine kinase [Zooshikella harenae]
MFDKPFSFSPSRQNLRRLCFIRFLALCGQSISLAYMLWAKVILDGGTLGSTMLIVSIVTLLTWVRTYQQLPVTEREFFAQLLFDVISFSILLYFSGGASNPFVFYYLIPIIISSAILPWLYTWTVTIISIAAYSGLLFFYQPLPIAIPVPFMEKGQVSMVNLHIAGMWINFMFSALLVTYFIVKMSKTVVLQHEMLSQKREEDLHNEQLMTVATFAAGTAHEFGTPLSTISVLLHELLNEHTQNTELHHDLLCLEQQVGHCRSLLKNLVNAAEASQQKNIVSLSDFCQHLIDQYQLLKPSFPISVQFINAIEENQIECDLALYQAFLNLIDNAQQAGASKVNIQICKTEQMVSIQLFDNGPGISLEIAEQLGKPFISTKSTGLGLGLSLSKATISRLGGTVHLFNVPSGGTLTDIRLPLIPDN